MKIIRFKPKTEFLLEFLENMKKEIVELEIDNIMICFKDKKNKQECTGYFNLDNGTRMECVGHIQMDIMDTMVAQNMDKYIEVIEL